MRIVLLAQHFKPESVGAAIWLHELATDLVSRGHQVTMLTAFPNYPSGVIHDSYKGKVYQHEVIDGVDVFRTWIYATTSRGFWPRIINFGSFCLSSLIGGLSSIKQADVIYAALPPLPLGVTAILLAKAKAIPVIVNIQDIYPHIAVALGVLKNPGVISFFERMEKWIYSKSDRVTVISSGFRDNLLSKGVPAEKIWVIPNWADAGFIGPGPKDNSFRREIQADRQFALIYSGNLSHNSNLEPVIGAAALLRNKPFLFVFVGDGVQKANLQRMAEKERLTNIQFKPFQPLSTYPQVLQAADMNLVTLSSRATIASVPSKIFKQMAAGRPVLAITAPGSELERLVTEARCGVVVAPDDSVALAESLEWSFVHTDELDRMGENGRRYLMENHERHRCIDQIENLLGQTLNR